MDMLLFSMCTVVCNQPAPYSDGTVGLTSIP